MSPATSAQLIISALAYLNLKANRLIPSTFALRSTVVSSVMHASNIPLNVLAALTHARMSSAPVTHSIPHQVSDPRMSVETSYVFQKSRPKAYIRISLLFWVHLALQHNRWILRTLKKKTRTIYNRVLLSHLTLQRFQGKRTYSMQCLL